MITLAKITAPMSGARASARFFAAVLAVTLPLLATSQRVHAAWELDSARSTVQFMSVKNETVAELHFFKVVSGAVADGGAVQVSIDLDSVETLVPIRNQRMRELLFETVRFPAATLSAEVAEELLTLPAGESKAVTLPVSIDLHGATATYPAKLLVTGLADGAVQVVLREPMLVSASDFDLAAGIQVLREVAGLKSISSAVPVTATLVFTTE